MIWRLLIFTALTLTPETASADYTAAGLQIGHPQIDKDGGRLYARLRYSVTESQALDAADLDFYATGLLSFGDAQASSFETHLIQEAYATHQTDRMALAIGRQLMLWGVADGFNPCDVITPSNFQLPAYAAKDPRFGVDAFHAEFALSDSLTLTGFAAYRPVSNLLPKGLDPTGTLDPDTPLRPDENGYGARLEWQADIGDLNVSAYRGPARFAVVAHDGTATTAKLPDVAMLGADFETVLGPWRLFSEIALHRFDGLDAVFLPDDEAQGVVGAELELSGANRLSLQFFHRNTQTDRPVATGALAPLSTGARKTYGQYADTQTGASVSYFWESADTLWSAEFSLATWMQDDTYVRARAKYRISDSQALYLYGDTFNGPDNSPFGALSDTSTLSFEYRQFF